MESQMSRSAKLNISLMIAGSLMWLGAAAADPLLTKPQIAKAADRIEACLAKESASKPCRSSGFPIATPNALFSRPTIRA